MFEEWFEHFSIVVVELSSSLESNEYRRQYRALKGVELKIIVDEI